MINKVYLKTLKQVEIAALLGYSERRIQQLHDEGLPRNGSGRGGVYDWEEVRAWEFARISRPKDGEALSDRQRKEKADADMAEMDRDLQAERLLEASEVRRVWFPFLGRLRDNLQGFADRCAPDLEGGLTLAEKVAVIKRHMNASLKDVVGELQAQESVGE